MNCKYEILMNVKQQYQKLIDRLFNVNLFDGIKLGLKNIEALHALLNFPANNFKTIHVAGTNGKGSVSTKIAKALEASGLKVGLYTSPHISCFRERIQINGEMISEYELVNHLDKLFTLRDLHKIPCTFFELATMLAFSYFEDSKVDIAIIETGLGGRLDATNIITPILSIITSISLDHTEVLGETIEKITKEKAGIIKRHVPVIIGPNVPFKLLESAAAEHNSPLVQVLGNFTHFEDENNALAKAALEYLNIPEQYILQGLKTKPICRMETFNYQGKTIVLDVAHNPDGLTRLFSGLKEIYPDKPLRIIFGLSQNKDLEACLKIIKNAGEHFHLCSARNGRGASVETLSSLFHADKTKISCHESVEDAICKALNYNDIIIICGTFFIMSDARCELKKIEPRDAQDMNEKTTTLGISSPFKI